MNVNGNYTNSMSAITSDNTKVRPKKEGEESGKVGGGPEGAPPPPPPPKMDSYSGSAGFNPDEETVADMTESSDALAAALATMDEVLEETDDSAVAEEEAENTFSGLSTSTKVSDEDRMKLVSQLKQEQLRVDAQFMQKLQGIFTETLGGLGYLDITPEIQAEAQEAVSEDGYWGVTQTSERMFDFALALSGGDPDVMAEMREAFEKGFASAEKSWGSELPEIAYETKSATLAMFDNWEAENT